MSGGSPYRLRGPLAVFTYCLVIAGALWLVIRLSGTYSSGVHLYLRYVNIPKGKALVQPVDTMVNVRLKAQGFKILSLEWFTKPQPFYIDVSRLKAEKSDGVWMYRVNLNKHAALIAEMNDIQAEFTGFKPDTIAFRIESVITRKVPVIPALDLSVEKDYKAAGPLIVEPDSVQITGTTSKVRQIEAVSTMEIDTKKLKTTLTLDAEIKKPLNGRVEVSPSRVRITIPVVRKTN